MFVTGGGTGGLGKGIAEEFARLGASIVIASRKPEHLEAGRAAIEALDAAVLTVECDIRDPDSIAAAFDAAEDAFDLPSVCINNRRPTSRCRPRTCRPTRGAPSSTLRSTAPSSSPATSPAVTSPAGARRKHRQHRGVMPVDRRSRVRPQCCGQGRREEHGREPGGGMGPLRHPGQRSGAGIDPHEDMTADIQGNLAAPTGEGRAPAGAAGGAPAASWAGRPPSGEPLRSLHLRSRLVVDRANWQRRSMTNPTVVPIQAQMGKGPFTLE
ncbi:MAG: SDR family NAD(P)-dependent oxidoreductase [Acidimicrobiales bacterium]